MGATLEILRCLLRKDTRRPVGRRRLAVEPLEDRRLLATIGNNLAIGDQLRIYRLALATTGEFTTLLGGVAATQTFLNDFVADVNALFERELAIHFNLVSGSNVIYTNGGTDPYSNGNPNAMLTQNQSTMDAVIGAANYDLGHVFGTVAAGGSGFSNLGVVGRNGLKAQGTSSSANPLEVSWLPFVAHEFGHQFAAQHSFNGVNGSCNERSAGSAYEVGSGTTIMSYAGLCGTDNVQTNEDRYYHATSYEEMLTYLANQPAATPFQTTNTGNHIPDVNGGANYTIPARTPFELTALGTDADAEDLLTYTWEELDLGPAQALGSPDNGSSPLFRSFPPSANPVRTFPELTHLLNNTASVGETLPTTSRALNFRATVRDNHAGGGGVNSDDVLLTVVNTGVPFAVTAPNTAVSWAANSLQTITWNVAGTNANGINAANVRILLSTDGGLHFPHVLAVTPNDGSHNIFVPNVGTTEARIKVQGSGNIFFDVSNSDFTIVANPALPGVTITQTDGTTVAVERGVADSYQLALKTNPAGSVQVTVTAGPQTLVSTDGLTFAASRVLTFTSTAPQTVYVQAVNDDLDEGGTQSLITHTITSSTSLTYPTSLIIDTVNVFIEDDELPPVVGIDFDFVGVGVAPTNWAQEDFFNTNFTDMLRDDGLPTSIDLTLSRSGAGTVNSVGVNARTVPRHLPVLDEIGGYSSRAISATAVWSDLVPGREYGVYVMGFFDRAISQSVAITGATALPVFVQTLVPGQLRINDELGDDDRTLQSYEEIAVADANGQIRVTVAAQPGSAAMSLAGIAIRQIPLRPPVQPEYVGVHRGNQFREDANGNGQWNGALGGDRLFVFGTTNDVPLAGDWNGDGFDEIGVQRGNQYWLDRNGNGVWDGNAGGDRLYTFRNVGDKPLVGDWDGDGDDEIGSWNAGLFYIDLNSNGVWDGTAAGDQRFTFGLSDDTPLAGDWDGDGDDQIGIHRDTIFQLDVNGNGVWNGNAAGDRQITFGISGDTPVKGDWDTDGADDIGVRRSNVYYLDANGNGVFNGTAGGDLQYAFGIASDAPLVGRWKANPLAATGNDKLGVRRQATDFQDANGNGDLETAAEGDRQVTFGVSSDVGIAGDWNGDGFDEVGVQRGNQYLLDQNGNGVFDGPDVTATFRNAGDKPLVGNWDGDGDDQLGSWNAGIFYLDQNSNNVWNGAGAGDRAVTFGLPSDTPLAGDWNGDGDDDIGVHRGTVFYLDANGNGVWNGVTGGDRQYTFGIEGDTPVTGDWDGDGTDEVGVKRNNVYYLDANGNGVFNGATGGDLEYVYGLSSDQPLPAKWRPVGALMAAGGPASSSGDAAPLTADALAPILQQAIILWARTGLNSAQLQTLGSVQFGITDLPGAQLGGSLGGTILIDGDAAGYGWNVDLESEIPASQSMDLLSVVLHELGHELGFDHDDDLAAMFETLAAGVRRSL